MTTTKLQILHLRSQLSHAIISERIAQEKTIICAALESRGISSSSHSEKKIAVEFLSKTMTQINEKRATSTVQFVKIQLIQTAHLETLAISIITMDAMRHDQMVITETTRLQLVIHALKDALSDLEHFQLSAHSEMLQNYTYWQGPSVSKSVELLATTLIPLI